MYSINTGEYHHSKIAVAIAAATGTLMLSSTGKARGSKVNSSQRRR